MNLRILTFLILLISNCFSSVLYDVSSKMSDHTFVKMPTNQSLNTLNLESSFLYYTNSGVWDSTKQEISIVSGPGTCCASPAIYKRLLYSSVTDTWSISNTPYTGNGHAYDGNALDPKTGNHYFYLFADKQIKKFNGSTWSSLPQHSLNSDCCNSLSWFPDINNGQGGLILTVGLGQTSWFNGTSWVNIAKPTTGLWGEYDLFSEYNPVLKQVLLGSGSTNETVMYTLDSQLKWTKKVNAPFSLTSSSAIVSVDPISGKYIVYNLKTQKWFEYNSTSDVWTSIVGPNLGTESVFQTPINSMGVMVFFKQNGSTKDVYVYKHSPGTVKPPPVIVPPPDTIPTIPPKDTVPPVVIPNNLPSFPGAEGWGSFTPGGRATNTKVYQVTNLASSGPGSFAEAMFAKGPRIITFKVSGVINLNQTTQAYLDSSNSYVSIEGQTSPGGITFTSTTTAGSSILMAYHDNFSNAVFRFLRFRANKNNGDCVTMNTVNNLIFDHCDFSGSRDETLDLTATRNITVQWCTINNSSIGQTYGFILAYPPTSQITIHHNLMANHVYRFPEMHWRGGKPINNGQLDYRNNVLFNGENYFIYNSDQDDDADGVNIPVGGIHMNIVGNTFKAGLQSPPNSHNPADWFFSMVALGNHISGFESDNVMIPRSGPVDKNAVSNRVPNKVSVPWVVPSVITQTSDSSYKLVLDKVGAWPRDPMNVRTIGEVKAATGQFQKDDDPLISSGPSLPQDLDNDGMADAWETSHGLNSNSNLDATQDKDGNGYLNIEEYVNELAYSRLGDTVPVIVIPPKDTTPTIPPVVIDSTKCIPDTIIKVVTKTDTLIKNVSIHDTLINTVTKHDTITLVKIDTLTNTIVKMDTVNIMKVDTLKFYTTDTLTVINTINVHDTINVFKTDTLFTIPRIFKINVE